jgi:hypothetical protein
MAATAVIPQSGDDRPYVTVGTDTNGGACWVVVGLGQQVRCCSGRRALAVLTEMLASRGISAPQ